MSEDCVQNQLRPIFRILTGALFFFGLYCLYLIVTVQYSLMVSSGLDLGFVLPGVLALIVFIVWVYISGYATLHGRLPTKHNQVQRKNT